MKKFVFAFLLLASPAIAADINMDAPIVGQDGQQMLGCEDQTKPACAEKQTLGVIVARALFNSGGDPRNPLAAEEKFKRGVLAMKIKDGGNADLSADDIVRAKAATAEAYSPIVVVQAWRLLDPKKGE